MIQNISQRSAVGIGIGLLAALVLVGAVVTPGAAQLAEGNISVTDAEHQHLNVSVDFSGSTDATASLLDESGTTVESVSVSGASGESHTLTLPFAGVADGDYSLSVGASDESVVTVTDTVMVTAKTPAMNVSDGDTVKVDVEFDSRSSANATVRLLDAGTQINTSSLSFDPVEASDGQGIETAEFELAQNVTGLNATVETSPAASHSQVWVDRESGLLAGAGFGAVDSIDTKTIAVGIALVLAVGIIIKREV